MTYCADCDRYFPSSGALNQHLNNSSVHRKIEVKYKYFCDDCQRSFLGESNLRSHLNSHIHRGNSINCPFCPRKFTLASGVATHLESGNCASGVNHETIQKWIRQNDRNHVIFNRMIEYPMGSDSDTWATDAAWNGREYECYFCHRGFPKLASLNQHLKSPVHRAKYYHCPKRSCGKEYSSLAALVMHIESESCSAMRFDDVQRNFGNIVQGRGLIGFR